MRPADSIGKPLRIALAPRHCRSRLLKCALSEIDDYRNDKPITASNSPMACGALYLDRGHAHVARRFRVNAKIIKIDTVLRIDASASTIIR
jgi:hypothetical protein